MLTHDLNPTSTLSERLDLYVQKQPYILPDARESYRNWWTREASILYIHYAHLPNYNTPRVPYKRSLYTWIDHRPMVSHTVVLPTGEEITYEWKSMHGKEYRRYKHTSRPWELCKSQDTFRKGFNKGVTEKKAELVDVYEIDQANAKKEWRAKKTKDFRKNDKVTSAWPMSCGAKRSAQISCNRSDRRMARQLIQQGRYNEVKTQADPVDTWMWN